MDRWIEVASTTEIADGSMKEIAVEGLELLLARAGDSYFATASRCPHMGGRLSNGTLKGTIVTCPRHGSQFDLRDGSVVRWLKTSRVVSALSKVVRPSRPIDTYQVRLDGDRILVKL